MRCLIVSGLLYLTTACAIFDREALRERAQYVFRYHNQVATRWLLMSESFDEGTDAEALWQADERMTTACAALDELATAYRDGRKPNRRTQRQIPKTVDICEAASRDMAELLDQITEPAKDPSIN